MVSSLLQLYLLQVLLLSCQKASSNTWSTCSALCTWTCCGNEDPTVNLQLTGAESQWMSEFPILREDNSGKVPAGSTLSWDHFPDKLLPAGSVRGGGGCELREKVNISKSWASAHLSIDNAQLGSGEVLCSELRRTRKPGLPSTNPYPLPLYPYIT